MKIIIPTCDKYRNILEANKYTMDKFGGKNLDVTVLGYKKPDFDLENWNFISLGKDTGSQNFTNDIWKFFKDFNDEYFIYGNDDIVAVDELDIDLLNKMEDKIKSDNNIVKISITSAAQKNYKNTNIFENNENFQYIEINQDADYRLSLHYGIWKTSYFKKYFQFNINPWEWELRNIAKNDGGIILGTIGRYFLDFGHILRRGGIINDNWYLSEYTKKILNNHDKKYINKIIEKI